MNLSTDFQEPAVCIVNLGLKRNHKIKTHGRIRKKYNNTECF